PCRPAPRPPPTRSTGRRRGDGFHLDAQGRPTNANPAADGTSVVSYPAASVCQANVRISQDWVVSHASWNHGRNDGFVKAKAKDSMAYFTESDLPFYYALGRTFPLCDRWFCSTMAQTDPNRRFLMAASSFGLVDDSFPASALHSNRPQGFGTVFEMLDHYGISWRNYYANLPSALLFLYLASKVGDNLRKIDQFYADAASGSLPAFCIVDPDFDLSSEENPQDIQNGEQFAASVINAVMHGPGWPDTVLIWLYDEHGGYYDHVPPQRAVRPDDIPPAVPADELDGDLFSWTGFRVPAVIVSPWAKRDHVSHTVYDHTSILKLLETKWNLPALSNRDANAANLLDTLDLGAKRPPFLTPPTLSAPVPVTSAQVQACAALDHGGD
ncbi:MAG TPA: alkaline phosphatase family protein, partial [Acidimicrobiales bacterium]|nr:alkaline phosphatase family protein [Acidimicrobiales bacterium]